MPAVLVAELKQKFTLLRQYPTRRSWPELAEAFGKPFKTLQYWQDGTHTRDAGRIPDWAVPILTQLVGELLTGRYSPDDVRQFVFGPAAQLEEELRTGAAVSLLALVQHEARRNTTKLFRRPPELGLVEIEAGSEEAEIRLKLDESFRLEIRRLFPSGYAVVLQHTQHVWALVPFAFSPKPPSGILVPGLDQSGVSIFMHERRDLGRHLFICLETPAPLPASMMALGRDELSLDKRALDTLATFYKNQHPAKRACHLLVVEFEPRVPR